MNTLQPDVRHNATQAPPRARCTGLVGRTSELEALVSAARRPPSVVFVEGEAGVGKTRLIEESLATVGPQQCDVLLGQCQRLPEPFPFGAVVQALGRIDRQRLHRVELSPVTGALRPHLPELADLLPAQLESLGEVHADRHRLFRAARELLAAIGPVLLVIEDLHWADEGSRGLLRYLLSDLPRNLGLLVSYRREEVPDGLPLGSAYRAGSSVVSTTVALRPFDVDGVRALVSEILDGHDVATGFAARLHERSAGIPFVVEETLRAFADPQGAATADDVTTVQLLDNVDAPVPLRETMLERLACLGPDARRLIEAAAVLASPAPLRLLAELSELPIDRAREAMLAALRGVVLLEQEDGSYGFRHVLAQQAVYQTLPGPQRERLHLRALRVLQRLESPPPLRLAEHSRKAGELADWLRYAEAAADQAVLAGDAEAATTALRGLLETKWLAAHDFDRLAVKLSRVAYNGLGQHEATAALQRALADERLCDEVRGEVRLTWGLLLIRQEGGLQAGRMEIATAIDELADRPQLRLKGMSVLAQPFTGVTPLREHRYWMDKVDDALAECAEASATDLLANNIASRLMTGDARAWPMIARLPERACEPSEQRSLARAYCNLADACAWVGYYQHATEFLQIGTRLAIDGGAPYIASTARSTWLHVAWLSGRWDGLAYRVQELLEECNELRPVASELALILGRVAVANGEWDSAHRYLADTGSDDPSDATSPVLLAARAELVRIRHAQEEYTSAAEIADQALEIMRAKQAWVWAAELAVAAVEAYCAAGRYRDAASLTDEFACAAVDLDAPAVEVGLLMCRGILAVWVDDASGAAKYLRDAAERARTLPAPYLAARAVERLASYRLAGGDTSCAAELAGIADEFDALGAARDAARCRYLLRANGAGLPSRRGRRGYGDELSPRERDVSRLVADGHTNQEIADALYLSRRTVEQHVAKVLHKLNVGSRTELQRG